MSDPLTTLEAEITAAGHQLERTYEWEDVPETRNGEGWVVRIDGELVATGASAGRVEAGLREWWRGNRREADG